MDCRQVAFSAEKSQERIHTALQVFPRKLLMRILAFALHLLGARRKEVAALVEMPEESVKTLLRLVLRDGFPAVRDRRFSAVSPMATALPSPPQIAARRDPQGWKLLTNVLGDYVSEVSKETWEQFSVALRSQSDVITDLIQNEEGPQRQHNAQQAFGNLNEALREYFAPIDEMAAWGP